MANRYSPLAVQVRRKTQRDKLRTVLAMPAPAQGGALFALWPDKLPRIARKNISKEALAGWRALRAEVVDNRLMQDMYRQMLVEGHDDMMDELEAEMIEKHGEQAQAIARVASSLSQLKKIVVALNSNLSTEFELDDDCEDEIILAFCMALEAGGGITLRQTLTLRSQVKNEVGEMEWRAQERLYGIHCDDGQWEGLTAAQIRDAYQFDEDGNKLEADPITSFGDARELIRRMK